MSSSFFSHHGTCNSRCREWAAGFFVFAVSALVSAFLVIHLDQMRVHEKQDAIKIQAQENIYRLHHHIDQIMALSYPVAAAVGPDGSVTDFAYIAEKLMAHYPLVSEIALAPGGVVNQVIPTEGNEKALGLDLLNDPRQRSEALLARDTRKLTLAGPLELVQGGEGLVGRLPLFRGENEKFWGFALIVIRFPDILQASALEELNKNGFGYTLSRIHPGSQRVQVIASSASAPLDQPVETRIDLPNAQWTLQIAPKGGWHDVQTIALHSALGLFISLLLGYIAKQYAELRNYRDVLELRVQERVEEVSRTRNQLHLLLDTIPDLVWLKDVEGNYLLCNPMFERFFGAKEEEIVGKSDYDFVDPKLADFFRQKDRLAMEKRGASINEEWITFADDGRHALMETIKTPVIDETGKLVGILGIARDITLRKHAEEHLFHTEKLLEEMSEAAHIGGWEFDPKSGEGSWTAEVARIYDMPPDTVVDKTVGLSVFSGEWYDKIITAIDRAVNRAVPYDLELQMTTPAGNTKWVRTIGIPVIEKGEVIRIRGSMQDITAQKTTEEKVHWLAHFDPLTGLPNRTLLNDRLNYAVRIAYRNKASVAFLYLDLDHFKNINENLGHEIGDELLVQVSLRIQSMIRESDTLSRQGGDEFMILLTGTDADSAAHVAEKLLEAIAQPYRVQHHELTVSASVGIALYPIDGTNLTTLSQAADAAMYRAKHEGRNRYCFFAPEMQARSARNLELENALRHSLARGELEVYYQPQLSLSTGSLVGAEALLRWKHPTLGMIAPDEFIPIAEESGQIIAIGEWVLRTSLRQLKEWIAGGSPPFIMAVNLSAIQFRDPRLVPMVLEILTELQLPHEYLELELTERIASENPLQAIEIMNTFYRDGIRMSIDDFGTGYSSLSYLKRFRVYKLKIDQSFIHDVTENPEDKTIVNTIINMAHSLGMITIAEGVETAEQLELLRSSGCDEVQGYYYSKPLPAAEFEQFFASV